jgi:hypothetical protein
MNLQDILNFILSLFTTDNTMHLKVVRTSKTIDGIFGQLFINDVFECDTVESLVHALPANTYSLSLYNSPDHGCVCPLLDTSAIGRTYCEIHIANYPSQLLGCIGLGESLDGDGVDSSGVAFEAFMKKFKLPADISIVEDY